MLVESWYVTAILNQCPHCQQGRLFEGWLKLQPTCEVCGVRYERWAGAWTGPTVAGYGVGAGTAVILTFSLSRLGLLVPGAEWGIGITSCLVILAAFRPLKAGWLGMMYDWGYIYADPVPREPEPEAQVTTPETPTEPLTDL